MSRIARQSDGWVNPFMIGVDYWNGTNPKRKGKPHKANKKKIMVKEGKLTEKTIRISTMKDVSFAGRDRLQLVGKKGKLGLDRKSVGALAKAVRMVLGRSFTTHEAKLNEAKMVTLPNGVKVKIEFKGITLQQRGKKPVFLDRNEMMTFFKATQKYMKQGLTAGKIKEACQKGYKTHPTRKTKKMFGKRYRNCIKAEDNLNEAKETIFDVAARVLKNKSMENYKSKKGLVKLDMQTANLLVKVFKKVNPKMKKHLAGMGFDNPAGLVQTLWAVVK